MVKVGVGGRQSWALGEPRVGVKLTVSWGEDHAGRVDPCSQKAGRWGAPTLPLAQSVILRCWACEEGWDSPGSHCFVPETDI